MSYGALCNSSAPLGAKMSDIDRDMRRPAEIDRSVAMTAGMIVIGAIVLLFIIGGGMAGFTE